MSNSPKRKQDAVPENASPEALRRHFLKKFGRYAVSTPAVTFTLMSTMSSKAVASPTNSDVGG